MSLSERFGNISSPFETSIKSNQEMIAQMKARISSLSSNRKKVDKDEGKTQKDTNAEHFSCCKELQVVMHAKDIAACASKTEQHKIKKSKDQILMTKEVRASHQIDYCIPSEPENWDTELDQVGMIISNDNFDLLKDCAGENELNTKTPKESNVMDLEEAANEQMNRPSLSLGINQSSNQWGSRQEDHPGNSDQLRGSLKFSKTKDPYDELMKKAYEHRSPLCYGEWKKNQLNKQCWSSQENQKNVAGKNEFDQNNESWAFKGNTRKRTHSGQAKGTFSSGNAWDNRNESKEDWENETLDSGQLSGSKFSCMRAGFNKPYTLTQKTQSQDAFHKCKVGGGFQTRNNSTLYQGSQQNSQGGSSHANKEDYWDCSDNDQGNGNNCGQISTCSTKEEYWDCSDSEQKKIEEKPASSASIDTSEKNSLQSTKPIIVAQSSISEDFWDDPVSEQNTAVSFQSESLTNTKNDTFTSQQTPKPCESSLVIDSWDAAEPDPKKLKTEKNISWDDPGKPKTFGGGNDVWSTRGNWKNKDKFGSGGWNNQRFESKQSGLKNDEQGRHSWKSGKGFGNNSSNWKTSRQSEQPWSKFSRDSHQSNWRRDESPIFNKRKWSNNNNSKGSSWETCGKNTTGKTEAENWDCSDEQSTSNTGSLFRNGFGISRDRNISAGMKFTNSQTCSGSVALSGTQEDWDCEYCDDSGKPEGKHNVSPSNSPAVPHAGNDWQNNNKDLLSGKDSCSIENWDSPVDTDLRSGNAYPNMSVHEVQNKRINLKTSQDNTNLFPSTFCIEGSSNREGTDLNSSTQIGISGPKHSLPEPCNAATEGAITVQRLVENLLMSAKQLTSGSHLPQTDSQQFKTASEIGNTNQSLGFYRDTYDDQIQDSLNDIRIDSSMKNVVPSSSSLPQHIGKKDPRVDSKCFSQNIFDERKEVPVKVSKEDIANKNNYYEQQGAKTFEENPSSKHSQHIQYSHSLGSMKFEGRTLLKGGVNPRHIPKNVLPAYKHEKLKDPRSKPCCKGNFSMEIPLPPFFIEFVSTKRFRKVATVSPMKKPDKKEKQSSCESARGTEMPIMDRNNNCVSQRSSSEDWSSVQESPVKQQADPKAFKIPFNEGQDLEKQVVSIMESFMNNLSQNKINFVPTSSQHGLQNQSQLSLYANPRSFCQAEQSLSRSDDAEDASTSAFVEGQHPQLGQQDVDYRSHAIERFHARDRGMVNIENKADRDRSPMAYSSHKKHKRRRGRRRNKNRKQYSSDSWSTASEDLQDTCRWREKEVVFSEKYLHGKRVLLERRETHRERRSEEPLIRNASKRKIRSSPEDQYRSSKYCLKNAFLPPYNYDWSS